MIAIIAALLNALFTRRLSAVDAAAVIDQQLCIIDGGIPYI